MSSPTSQKPGRRIGQGMLTISFILVLIALTAFFQGRLNNQDNPNRRPQSNQASDGAIEVVLESNRQGHYVANGSINGIAVTFLLDTGATDVAIPSELARKAKLIRGGISRAATANGVIEVYSTSIGELRLGNIVLNNVSASITSSMSGNTVLLGMSALSQIEFTQRGSTLTLRQYPNTL